MPLITIGLLAAFAAGGCAGHQCRVEDEDQRTVTTDEIDAAGKLTFDQSRAEVLTSIAARKGLNPIEQQQLVCVAMNKLQFDDSIEHVLNTLIDNPDFSQYGKSKILQNITKLKFDDTRTKILKRMQGRGEATTGLWKSKEEKSK